MNYYPACWTPWVFQNMPDPTVLSGATASALPIYNLTPITRTHQQTHQRTHQYNQIIAGFPSAKSLHFKPLYRGFSHLTLFFGNPEDELMAHRLLGWNISSSTYSLAYVVSEQELKKLRIRQAKRKARQAEKKALRKSKGNGLQRQDSSSSENFSSDSEDEDSNDEASPLQDDAMLITLSSSILNKACSLYYSRTMHNEPPTKILTSNMGCFILSETTRYVMKTLMKLVY